MEQFIQRRDHLMILFREFIAATGYGEGTACRVIAKDARFLSSLRGGERPVREKTYSRYLARFSALWPSAFPWPDGIERPEVGDEIPQELAEHRRRIEARLNRKEDGDGVSAEEKLRRMTWPEGSQWPGEISVEAIAT